MGDVRHLNRALALLRKPARQTTAVDQQPAHVAGLLALGWEQCSPYGKKYLTFKKEAKRALVFKGDAVHMDMGDKVFRPLPPKARRNIRMAGQ